MAKQKPPPRPESCTSHSYLHSQGMQGFKTFAAQLKEILDAGSNKAFGFFHVSLLKEDEPILHECLINNALGHLGLVIVDMQMSNKPCNIFSSNMKHTFEYTVKLSSADE